MSRMWILLPALAGSLMADGQIGFVVHYDSVQSGLPGQPTSVAELSDGGFLLSGIQFSPGTTGQLHVLLRRTDQWGHAVSESEVQGNDPWIYNNGTLGAMVKLDTGFAEGLTRYDPHGWACDMMLYWFDENGDTVRTRNLMSYTNTDSIVVQHRQTIRLADGGFALGGFFDAPDASAQALLVRTNANGDTTWTRKLGYQNQAEEIWSLCELPDHGFALSVVHSGGGPSDDHTLIRTDSMGHQLWRVQYGEYGQGVPSVRFSPDSTLITFSDHKMDLGSSAWQEIELRKWNLTGSLVWSRFSHRTPNSNTWPRDLEVLPDGTIITSIGYGRTAMIAKFDANGDSIWSRFYYVFSETNNYNEAIINDIDPTSDGGFVMCGWKIQDQGDPTDGLQTWFLIKTDSLGCGSPGCQTLGVNEFVIGLQEHLKIWPNPVAQGGTVNVELSPPGGADLGPVKLVVQDVLGREVRRDVMVRTVNGVRTTFAPSSGATHLASGTYLLHLVSDGKWLAGGKLVIE